MYRGRKFLFVLLAIIPALCVAVLVAKEKKIGILKEVKEGEGINKGIVVAFGEKLEPPYHVTLDNGKVLINGFIFSPREKEPNLTHKKIQVSDLNKKRTNIEKEITNKYMEYLELYGDQEANKRIVNEYKNNELISTLSLSDDGTLKIEYFDGYVEHLVLGPTKDTPTQEEISTLLKNKQEVIKSALQKGYGIAFGFRYTLYIHSNQMSRITKAVENYESNIISKEEAENIIMKLAHEKEFVNDILTKGGKR